MPDSQEAADVRASVFEGKMRNSLSNTYIRLFFGSAAQVAFSSNIDSPEQVTSSVAQIAPLEMARRQQLLVPSILAMAVLTSTAYIPAITPAFVPLTFLATTCCIIMYVLALIYNRAGRVRTATAIFFLAMLLGYMLALFGTTSGHGRLSYQYFTAGDLYYIQGDVLAGFAAWLLLDDIWPYLVHLIIALFNVTAIIGVPHDATFNAFANGLGGPLFLAAATLLGQMVVCVFGIATARTLHRALLSASRIGDLQEVNKRIAERQSVLQQDIQQLQQAHAAIASGKRIPLSLSQHSELYPVAMSLNLMADRLLRLNSAGQELQRIEQGLSEITRMVNCLGKGDFVTRPHSTGSMVDGVLASFVQLQGQLAQWVTDLMRGIHELQSVHQQALTQTSAIMQPLRALESSSGRLPATASPTVTRAYQEHVENLQKIHAQTEALRKLLQRAEGLQQHIANHVERLQTKPTAPPS